MKTLANLLMSLAILVSFSACNDKNDVPPLLVGDPGPQFFVNVSFIDEAGNDIVETIEKTPMTLAMSSNIMISEEATYFKVEDYQLETYLDGKLVNPPSPFKYNFVYCLLGEQSINGKTAIELIAQGPEQQLKILLSSLDTSKQDFGKHSIEWHFTCPKLFGDNEKHILKLDFELIVPNKPGFGFQGTLYLDEKPQTLYYPESYGITPTYDLDNIDVTIPYCIIQL